MTKRALTILLASPRGFCAGVNRAIHIVEEALRRYGRPVYVRHEIVHNRYVVHSLEAQGAVFVEELDEVPNDRPVVFSAHGVPKTVPAAAAARGMFYLDATCPLVTKVHHEAARHVIDGRQIIMIGHSGHPEVVGTMGQVADGSIMLVENRRAGRDGRTQSRQKFGLYHPDHAVGRRHGGHRRGPAPALPRHRGTA